MYACFMFPSKKYRPVVTKTSFSVGSIECSEMPCTTQLPAMCYFLWSLDNREPCQIKAQDPKPLKS